MSLHPAASLNARLMMACERPSRVIVPGRLGAELCWSGGEACVPAGPEVLACLGISVTTAWELALARLARLASQDAWMPVPGAPGVFLCVPSAGDAADRLLAPEALRVGPHGPVAFVAPGRDLLFAAPLVGDSARDALSTLVALAAPAAARSARPLEPQVVWFDGRRLRPVVVRRGPSGTQVIPDTALALVLCASAS